MVLQLHPSWRCPCGVEWGDLTDHGQGEKLCPAHMGQDGYRGGVPRYVKGKAFPEGFADFVEEQERKGVTMPKEAKDFANKTRGTEPEAPVDQAAMRAKIDSPKAPEPVIFTDAERPKQIPAPKQPKMTVAAVKKVSKFLKKNATSHKVHPAPKPAKKAEKVKKKK